MLKKRAKKTGLNARRVEQGGFTSQETEKNQKVPKGVIYKWPILYQSYYDIVGMSKLHALHQLYFSF